MNDAVECEERVRGYVDFVYAAARRQMGAEAVGIEDVVQAVFLVMARKGREGKLPKEKYMMGWLVKVTRYAVKEARRGAVRRGYHEKRAALERREAWEEDEAHARYSARKENGRSWSGGSWCLE